ncbi:hypothetical protein VZT92_013628 [Zoarces viviparus]|uniref:Uncharacterized protein n=1 Tax=Zoarces viviparus TaxID=48416 RepID=A0AAW1F3Q6_ZOAVI
MCPREKGCLCPSATQLWDPGNRPCPPQSAALLVLPPWAKHCKLENDSHRGPHWEHIRCCNAMLYSEQSANLCSDLPLCVSAKASPVKQPEGLVGDVHFVFYELSCCFSSAYRMLESSLIPKIGSSFLPNGRQSRGLQGFVLSGRHNKASSVHSETCLFISSPVMVLKTRSQM